MGGALDRYKEFLEALPIWQAELFMRQQARAQELENVTPMSTPFMELVKRESQRD
jgi:hypothetical protein